jgi:hypothetical protein
MATQRSNGGRIQVGFTLAPESLDWLNERAEKTGARPSRIIDLLIKAEREREEAQKGDPKG